MTELQQAIQGVLNDLPAPIEQGKSPEWGPPGNKATAIYLAALLGHTFDPKCTSCDHDLYTVLKHAAK